MVNMYEKTLKLLRDSDLSISEIARQAGINYHWLSSFHQERGGDPGVQRTQKLYNFLVKNK